MAAAGHLAPPAWWLYAGGVLWTLGYDTIYAHQDKRDDAKAGIRSTARRFGARAKPPIALFYVAAYLCFAVAGHLGGLGPSFDFGMAALCAGTAWLLRRWNPDEPSSCLWAFKANRWVGLGVFAAIVAGHCWL